MVSGDAGKGREIEPLRILTGGSPRLLVIVAEFARHRSLRQLLEDLVTLIDNHTEYFRGHLDVLAKTERRVYLAAIDLWQPSSTGEIAARARMDVRSVSALLGRLVDRGAVLVDGTGRKRRYAAAERLYSIYYKLRRERGDAAIVHHLIPFMTAFYSDDELATLAVSEPGRVRLENSAAPDLQLEVARALVNKGYRQIEIGRAEEALRTSDELERRCGAFTDGAPVAFELWQAKWMRAHALLVQEEHQAALSVFRSVCARFVVDDARMLRETRLRVPTLIAAGAAARDVVEILSADRKTADALAPLVVALRQLAGEPVRASTEVLEVAADVRKRIEAVTAAWRSSRGLVARN